MHAEIALNFTDIRGHLYVKNVEWEPVSASHLPVGWGLTGIFI